MILMLLSISSTSLYHGQLFDMQCSQARYITLKTTTERQKSLPCGIINSKGNTDNKKIRKPSTI